MSGSTKPIRLLVNALVCLSLSACGSAEFEFTVRSPAQTQNTDQQTFDTVTVSQTVPPGPGASNKTNWVVRDASTWSSVWMEFQSLQATMTATPNINFNQNQVIGVSRYASDGCNRPYISEIKNLGNKLEVLVATAKPRAEQFCKQQAGLVTHFVTTPTSNLPVDFIDLP